MNASFLFKVDVSKVAEQLRRTIDEVEPKVVDAVETLSIASHAYITNLANSKFASDDFKRQFYLGTGQYGKEASGSSSKNQFVDQSAKHLRWIKITDGIWVVELDEKARWIEEGRDETFMGEWLLKPGSKGVKRAKDGSMYRAIPFKQTAGKKTAKGASPVLADIVRNHVREAGISLTRIEKNESGMPKLGILHKLDIRPSDATGYAPGAIYSRPRTEEEARLTGLKAHGGIFKLSGAVVVQNAYDRQGELIQDRKHAEEMIVKKKAKVKKEVVTFRTISSKHEAEHRWMYPKVEAAGFFQKAYDHAEKQWQNIILPSIERALSTE